MRELELPNKGPEAVVVVRGTDGVLYDLSHTPAVDVAEARGPAPQARRFDR